MLKRSVKRISLVALVGCALGIAAYFTILKVAPFPYEAIKDIQYSKCIFDGQGNLLRVFTNKDGLWLMPVELKEINPRLIDATLSIEDNRFRRHFGVDPLAVMRAAKLNLSSGKVISGASTISMQVMRIIENRKRSLPNKIIEAVHAVRLEALYSKDD
ncbi:MAG: transglycosylase domain-containing protein, partial [Candidatus Omnitrophota bacterium]